MVDLPEVPRRLVLTEAPRNRITPADVAAPSFALAQALGATSEGFLKLAKDQQDAIDTTIVSKQLDAAQTQAQALAEQAQGDVNVFQKAWQAYARDSLKNVPKKYQGEVEGKLIGIGGDTYRRLFAEAAQRTGQIATNAINTRIDTLRGEMTDLARVGQVSGEDYQSRQRELDDLILQKENNRLIAYGPEQAKADREMFHDEFLTAAYTGELETTYKAKGFAAAEARAQEILNDRSDGLDTIHKIKAINSAKAAVKAIFQADAGARRDFMADLTLDIAKLKDGTADPNDPMWNDKIRAAKDLQLPGAVSSIETARAVARTIPMSGMNIEESNAYGAALLAPPTGDASEILKAEEGFRTEAYFDVNGYRVGYGSDTVTHADGTVEKVTKDTVVTKADADRDLARRTQEFTTKAAGQVGDAWDSLPANVKAALTSVAYNYGELPQSVVTAAKTGDASTIADTVQALPDNPARRAREAAVIRGSYVKGLVTAVQAQDKSHLTDAMAEAEKLLDAGRTLEPAEIGSLVTAAQRIDDDATYKKVAVIGARAAANAVSASDTIAAGQITQQLDQMRAPGLRGEELVRIAVSDQLQANQKRRLDLLKNDPYAVAIERKLAAPGPTVDFANVAEAGQILASRVGPLQQVAYDERTGPLSVLRPGEADALTAAWNTGDANKKLALVSNLAQALPGDTLMATLAKINEKQAGSLAIAGALAKVNPQAGTAVIRGNEALKANPKFAFSNDQTDYLEARDKYFPSTVVAPAMSAAWQAHIEAARAVYADASARAGDSSGKFDEARWQSAIDLVTGGVLEQGDGKIIAPRPDVNQSKFDAVMAGLPEGAFAGAVTPDGTPLTARFVRSQGTLQSYGDGRYVIELGGTGAYALRTPRSPSEAGVGGPFVLDLRPWLDASFVPMVNAPGLDAARDLSNRRGKIGLFGF